MILMMMPSSSIFSCLEPWSLTSEARDAGAARVRLEGQLAATLAVYLGRRKPRCGPRVAQRAWMHSGRDQGYGGGKRRERGGAVASRGPGHEAEAALVDGVAGVGGGRYFNYRPPLGFCGPFDPTCAAEIRQGRGLTWSFPVSSGAWRQDGERRSSAAPTLLQDAGSAGAAASFGRRRGGHRPTKKTGSARSSS